MTASTPFSAVFTQATRRHCQSTSLSVTYGKYGYYYKCRGCEGNTPIQLTCGGCGGKARTRKAGDEFYADCPDCGSSVLYHRNTPS